jgi:phosphatidate cytidylyltransferase
MLWQRVITALILVPLVLFGLIYGGTQWVALVTGIIIAVAAREWANLSKLTKPYQYICYILVILLCLAGTYFIRQQQFSMLVIYAGVIWWLMASGLIIKAEISGELPLLNRQVKVVAGMLTLVPSWLGLVILHRGGDFGDRFLLIFLFMLIWSADIFGYFCGKKWGKHKIAPLVSPGKTWQGAAGAMIGCSAISIGFSINKQFQLSETIIFLVICLATVLISIIGDLMESLLKRNANVKDSGTLLPGHGGVLDRIDSFTAASPVFLALISLSGVYT